MRGIKFINGLRQIFCLYRVQTNRRRQNLEQTRYWLDRAIGIEGGSNFDALALAADGLQKVNENELNAARSTFTNCQRLVVTENGGDELCVGVKG